MQLLMAHSMARLGEVVPYSYPRGTEDAGKEGGTLGMLSMVPS